MFWLRSPTGGATEACQNFQRERIAGSRQWVPGRVRAPTTNDRFDLALEPRRAKRTLLMHRGMDFGAATIASYFFEQLPEGSTPGRRRQTDTAPGNTAMRDISL